MSPLPDRDGSRSTHLPACRACRHFGLHPEELAVDLSGTSPKETDGLCVVHRARAGEGYCVLCGRREPWVLLHEGSVVGCCRPCFVASFGEGQAAWIEATWGVLDRAADL